MNTIFQNPAPGAEAASRDHDIQDFFLVSGSDIFALGHYPGNPIYPGVLIAERLCRAAEMLAAREWGQLASVVAIKRIQYLDAVLPGDAVELSVSIKKSTTEGLEISAVAKVGDKPKTRATLCCAVGAKPLAYWHGPKPVETGERPLTYKQITGVLPHRYPFLLIDAVEDHQPGVAIRARKVVNRASPLFLEQQPLTYPQGLVMESIGQAGIALFFMSRESSEPVDIVLGSISDTEIHRRIPFDSVLTLNARIERMLPNGVVFSGEARIGDQVVTRVGSLVAMIDPR